MGIMDSEQLFRIINALGSLLTGGGLGVLSYLFFFDSKKRTENAKAKQEEAAARKMEEESLSLRASEWRKLYEEAGDECKELNAKIDKLYDIIEEGRERIRELQEKNMQLSLELQKAQFMKCEVKGCEKRQPPTGY